MKLPSCVYCGCSTKERTTERLRFSTLVYVQCTNEKCGLLNHVSFPAKDTYEEVRENNE